MHGVLFSNAYKSLRNCSGLLCFLLLVCCCFVSVCACARVCECFQDKGVIDICKCSPHGQRWQQYQYGKWMVEPASYRSVNTRTQFKFDRRHFCWASSLWFGSYYEGLAVFIMFILLRIFVLVCCGSGKCVGVWYPFYFMHWSYNLFCPHIWFHTISNWEIDFFFYHRHCCCCCCLAVIIIVDLIRFSFFSECLLCV